MAIVMTITKLADLGDYSAERDFSPDVVDLSGGNTLSLPTEGPTPPVSDARIKLVLVDDQTPFPGLRDLGFKPLAAQTMPGVFQELLFTIDSGTEGGPVTFDKTRLQKYTIVIDEGSATDGQAFIFDTFTLKQI